jgi:hypothetical protein
VAKALRKTLPRDLPALMKAAQERGDDAELRATLAKCQPDARLGTDKKTALMLPECTPELAAWLLSEHGADVNAADSYGKTALHHSARGVRNYGLPVEFLLERGADVHATSNEGLTALHVAADAHHLHALRTLVERGAGLEARSSRGLTPLEYALVRVQNTTIPAAVGTARFLIDAGAVATEGAQAAVRTAVERFEAQRDGFAKHLVEATAAGAVELCSIFGLSAPAPVRRHDGTSPIVTTEERWQDQHAELWTLLVPTSGPCPTVQGEVIRITGRVASELRRNGGINWDADYRAMLSALATHLASHASLGPEQLEEARAAMTGLPGEDGGTQVLARLAVAWVARNPDPVRLESPPYRR